MTPASDEFPLTTTIGEIIDAFVALGGAPHDGILTRLRELETALRQSERDSLRVEQAEEKRRIEVALSRRVWKAFLPDAAPMFPGYVIGGGTYPAEEIGGDFLDYLDLPDGSLGIAIGDAMGHGVSAALVIFQLCSYLRALALSERTVGRILALANRRLARDVPDGFFATLLLARLDLESGTLVHGSAGHSPAFVMDENGEVRMRLNSTGMALGIQARGDFPTGPVVTLWPGELVLLLTDGILEPQAENGVSFGADRALAIVRAHRHEHPDAIVRALVNGVRAYAPDYPHDDMTAVVVKFVGRDEEEG